ncbi:hypothetical protein Patl1_20839 [Pistacia atlantica]|uniref:Uncharacterized protein n=1 Tax=Pistacia atlantica TaxID=434234 RepID=A0ACC1BMU8_9ROSI|nr:hypothetical protein Patl1_20839 [Pistacia atlantica]
MASTLFTRSLLGHRLVHSSLSKPQILTSFLNKRLFNSQPDPKYTAYKISSIRAPLVMASSVVGTRANYSTLSVSPNEPVVSVDWLHANLREPDLKILDASWYMPDEQRNPIQEYQVAHIPGALFFDVDGIADRTSNLPHMLPSEEAFAAAASALGIQNKDGVVVYDGKGLFSAARVWWMFRVFGHERIWVLDGGLPRWRASGFDVESSASGDAILKASAASEAIEKIYQGQAVGPITFETKFQPHLVWTLEQVKGNIEEKAYQHVDARSKAGKATNRSSLFSFIIKIATCSTKCLAEPETPQLQPNFSANTSVEVLKKWGCNDDDISKIFSRRPSLREINVVQLQSKLNLLSGLGIKYSELFKIINCCPRFLSSRLNHCFDEQLDYFTKFFGSKTVFGKAIVRNPSLLNYDFNHSIKPAIALYEQMGLSTKDLIPMLVSRPTLIPRSSLNDQKIDYINRSGVSKTSKMYKYVVTLIAISRTETIQEKISNFQKFGFLEDEILRLFGRSPLLITMSIEKVQRNMTFVMGTLKFPASVVLQHPFLLYVNLEAVLKPRLVLAGKIQDMGLSPEMKGQATILRSLRMTEKRFLKVYVNCHPQEVADELMEAFRNAKCAKRLAVDSKRIVRKGFPF